MPPKEPNPNKPVFSPGAYPGSKGRMIKWLRREGWIPAHTLHVSVFGGLGAELLSLPPSDVEICNDLSFDVFNFMAMLKYRYREMIHLAKFSGYSQREYELAYDVLHSKGGSNLERAHAFGLIANQCHVGSCPMTAHRSSWGKMVQGHGQPDGWANIDVTYEAVARRLRRIQLFNQDWQWILRRCDSKDTLFTIDPPYLGQRDLYQLTLPEKDHAQLLAKVMSLKGKVIVFHKPHPLYEAELKSWHRIDRMITTAMGTTLPGHPKKRHAECIWVNFSKEN